MKSTVHLWVCWATIQCIIHGVSCSLRLLFIHSYVHSSFLSSILSTSVCAISLVPLGSYPLSLYSRWKKSKHASGCGGGRRCLVVVRCSRAIRRSSGGDAYQWLVLVLETVCSLQSRRKKGCVKEKGGRGSEMNLQDDCVPDHRKILMILSHW